MENRPARSVKTVRSGPLPVVACASTATPGRTKPVVSVTVPDTAPSLGAGACGRESGRDDCERDAPPRTDLDSTGFPARRLARRGALERLGRHAQPPQP